ncbi:MAG: ATP-binding cassette domain-containing protein, partial [Betaproteobacteria bacterium]
MTERAAATPTVGEPAAGQLAARLRAVTVGYDGPAVLEDVDLDVRRGALLAIFGPNGGGKTTLLKLIAGVLAPWSGTVETLGVPAGTSARR